MGRNLGGQCVQERDTYESRPSTAMQGFGVEIPAGEVRGIPHPADTNAWTNSPHESGHCDIIHRLLGQLDMSLKSAKARRLTYRSEDISVRSGVAAQESVNTIIKF